MKYKVICFDVDGTLYSPEICDKVCAVTIARHPFFANQYRKVRDAVRKTQHDFPYNEMKDLDFRAREARILASIHNNKISDKMARVMLDTYYYSTLRKQFEKRLSPRPEVKKLMEDLSGKGLKVGVLSDWPLWNKLEKLGIADCVDFKISSDDMGYLKPSKHCFEYLLEKLNVNKEDVLYIGDSVKKDVMGATGAGIDAVLINCKTKIECPQAKKVCRDWDEFESYLRKLMEE